MRPRKSPAHSFIARPAAPASPLPTATRAPSPSVEHRSDPATPASRDLTIRTLGDFVVGLPESAGGGMPNWFNQQSQDLLKCLLAAPGHHRTRDALVDLLWPDQDADAGRRHLRDALCRLRRALEPDGPPHRRRTYVVSDGRSLRLALGAGGGGPAIRLDCDAFVSLANMALAALEMGKDDGGTAEAALALYRGPFLPADAGAAWTRTARDEYQALWARLIRGLAVTGLAQRRYDQISLHLAELAQHLPDDEGVAYLSMLAHVGAGRRSGAARVYEALRAYLAEANATEPGSRIRELYERIRAGVSRDAILAGII